MDLLPGFCLVDTVGANEWGDYRVERCLRKNGEAMRRKPRSTKLPSELANGFIALLGRIDATPTLQPQCNHFGLLWNCHALSYNQKFIR